MHYIIWKIIQHSKKLYFKTINKFEVLQIQRENNIKKHVDVFTKSAEWIITFKMLNLSSESLCTNLTI